MYIVELEFFNQYGRCLGNSSVLAPGSNSDALSEFIRDFVRNTFLGTNPAYIHAAPEAGDPILVRMAKEG